MRLRRAARHDERTCVSVEDHARLVAQARLEGFVAALVHARYLPRSIVLAVISNADWIKDGDRR